MISQECFMVSIAKCWFICRFRDGALWHSGENVIYMAVYLREHSQVVSANLTSVY